MNLSLPPPCKCISLNELAASGFAKPLAFIDDNLGIRILQNTLKNAAYGTRHRTQIHAEQLRSTKLGMDIFILSPYFSFFASVVKVETNPTYGVHAETQGLP